LLGQIPACAGAAASGDDDDGDAHGLGLERGKPEEKGLLWGARLPDARNSASRSDCCTNIVQRLYLRHISPRSACLQGRALRSL
jgi:hypothetical protein